MKYKIQYSSIVRKMIRFAILLTVVCASVSAFSIQDKEVHRPPHFNIQDIEELQSPPKFGVLVKESNSSSNLVHCTATSCCASGQVCGANYSCLDGKTLDYVCNADPCSPVFNR
ncbi:unnamed protein product [Nezara viridula]|uniref:Uncharacterized protein n=1 Tax=Nezara viridula TaxID=85310 RepID=A0A9P0H9I7_NEZVI|nr:unnamed protein product [Nezara viridula]